MTFAPSAEFLVSAMRDHGTEVMSTFRQLHRGNAYTTCSGSYEDPFT